MPDKVYAKKDIQNNGWNITLWLEKKMYIAELNGNVYHMEPLGDVSEWKFKCKKAIISKVKMEKDINKF